MRRRILSALAAGLAFSTAASALAEAPPRPRAAGGVRLVAAAESAPATVVGEIVDTKKLDRAGHAATLRVATVLRGPLEKGADVAIAWEELAPSRAPRFAAGERVLVSLEALPGQSLWLARLPDAQARAQTLHVAMRGDAFLREPAPGTVDTLRHYLWLADEQREGATGAGYLVTLVASAEEPVAVDALARLAGHARLAHELDPTLAERLARAFVRDGASARFRGALAELITRHHLEATRPVLVQLAEREPPAPPEVYLALAGLDGELSPERAEALLASAPVAQRRVAARHLGGPDAVATLERVSRRDPAPEVRADALERLTELRGEAALERLLGALADPAAPVRGTAARLLGALGTPAVTPLRQVIEGNDPEAASAAVVALGLCAAPEAREALREIASHHAEERVRKIAELALGHGIGERH